MLVDMYVEATLVDEDLADQVWEQWNVGVIPDDLAELAWCILAMSCREQGEMACFQ